MDASAPAFTAEDKSDSRHQHLLAMSDSLSGTPAFFKTKARPPITDTGMTLLRPSTLAFILLLHSEAPDALQYTAFSRLIFR